MKRLIVAALLLATMATPAYAQETELGCVSVAIEWTEEGSPMLSEVLYRDEGVRTAIVGSYMWIQYLSDGSADSTQNVLSVRIEEGAEVMTTCTEEHDVNDAPITESTVTKQPAPAPVELPATITQTEQGWYTVFGRAIF